MRHREALGDDSQQLRLGAAVGRVDRHANHARPADGACRGAVECRCVDGVLGHELLRLRGEGHRLGLERGRLGLGQQRPDLGEHRVGARPVGFDKRTQRAQHHEVVQRVDHRAHRFGALEPFVGDEAGQPAVATGGSWELQRLDLGPPPRVDLVTATRRVVDCDGEGDEPSGGLSRAASVALAVQLDRLPAVAPSHAHLGEEDRFGFVVDLAVGHGRKQLDEPESLRAVREQPEEAARCVRGHG